MDTIELNEEQVIGLINALESSDAMQKTIAVMFLKSLLDEEDLEFTYVDVPLRYPSEEDE